MILPGRDDRPGDFSKVFAALCDLDKLLVWYASVQLRGYTLRKDDNGWLLVVRVVGQRGALVSFTSGHDGYWCWRAFLVALGRGSLEWRKDRFA